MSICKEGISDADCYHPDIIPHCNDEYANVNIAGASEPTELMSDSDCFCIEDDKGNKVCNPYNCDAGRRELSEQNISPAIQEEDCFCIEDSVGNTVCVPPNCNKKISLQLN
jgi:hypothetical protein